MKAILRNEYGNRPWLEISPEDAAESLALRYLFDGKTSEEICRQLVIDTNTPELSEKPTD